MKTPGIFLSIFINLFTILFSININGSTLKDFVKSPYFNEQICLFNYSPGIRVLINAPSANSFDSSKPTCLMFFALPNGNTIEWTVGKQLSEGDNFHYDVQHIGAQTRFLRNTIVDENLIIVYLENTEKSWPAWKVKHIENHDVIIKELVEHIKGLFANYNPYVVLTGHSGGGRFTFSFIDAFPEIPSYVKRISFLDSNYGYEFKYKDKLINWIKASDENYLSIIAYNDSLALLNGKRIVSDTGGTWSRSRMMKDDFIKVFKFDYSIDENFMKFEALNGRIKFNLRQNPNKEVLHTILVKKNGFIQGMLSGTKYESKQYKYYEELAYKDYIQDAKIYPNPLAIPPRENEFLTASAFIKLIDSLSFNERENLIYNEFEKGNIPSYYRNLINIKSKFFDAQGNEHELVYQVMPDYLAIGSDEDYCRIPMSPITAQKIADLYGAILPTQKLVDDIYKNSSIKLEPVTYYPKDNNNEKIFMFVKHNAAIDSQLTSESYKQGDLIGGIKKDVVICGLLADTNRVNHVSIYGWHRLDGKAIQPLTNIHKNSYVDYSHGVRLINNEALLDGKIIKISDLLKDKILYKIVSDEDIPLMETQYLQQIHQ